MEIKGRIHKAGGRRVRVIPMAGQKFDGLHQIEIMENNNWIAVVTGISKYMAEQIVNEATSRVILG